MRNGMMILVVLLIGVAVFAIFMVNGGQKPTTQSPQPAAESATDGATQVEGVQKVTVEGTEYKFMPSSLSFIDGETVEVTFKNTGKMPHDFVIDELGVKTKVLKSGEQEIITFTAKKGSYKFYCSVGNHRQMGMEGMVEVK